MEKRDISDIKESETFVVTIQHSQNSTWQGEVTWVTGENEKIHFRSGLELIKIINEAISKNS
ncbi:MAG: hypothetical protein IJV29_05965 [Butyrivibrio sp.]|nr:hypothetical protein [Butyrivibrio sp.]